MSETIVFVCIYFAKRIVWAEQRIGEFICHDRIFPFVKVRRRCSSDSIFAESSVASHAKQMSHEEFITAAVVSLKLAHTLQPVSSATRTLFCLYWNKRNAVDKQANIHTHLLHRILISDDETVIPNIVEIYKTYGDILFVDRHINAIHQLVKELLVALDSDRITQVVEQSLHRRLGVIFRDIVYRHHLFDENRLDDSVHLQAVIMLQLISRHKGITHLRQPLSDYIFNGLGFGELRHKNVVLVIIRIIINYIYYYTFQFFQTI